MNGSILHGIRQAQWEEIIYKGAMLVCCKLLGLLYPKSLQRRDERNCLLGTAPFAFCVIASAPQIESEPQFCERFKGSCQKKGSEMAKQQLGWTGGGGYQ